MPIHQQKYHKGKVTTQATPQKKFDYTAVADLSKITIFIVTVSMVFVAWFLCDYLTALFYPKKYN